jgi:hypothetical protein
MVDRHEMVMVPLSEANRTPDDIVADHHRNGWQLVSTRVEPDGLEIALFRRPV